jgi:hypothetical protein
VLTIGVLALVPWAGRWGYTRACAEHGLSCGANPNATECARVLLPVHAVRRAGTLTGSVSLASSAGDSAAPRCPT